MSSVLLPLCLICTPSNAIYYWQVTRNVRRNLLVVFLQHGGQHVHWKMDILLMISSPSGKSKVITKAIDRMLVNRWCRWLRPMKIGEDWKKCVTRKTPQLLTPLLIWVLWTRIFLHKCESSKETFFIIFWKIQKSFEWKIYIKQKNIFYR